MTWTRCPHCGAFVPLDTTANATHIEVLHGSDGHRIDYFNLDAVAVPPAPREGEGETLGVKAKYMGSADDASVRWGSNDDPRGVLTPDKWYAVDSVEEHSQHTKLWIGGKKYNCVDFVCPLHGRHLRAVRDVGGSP